MKPIFSICLICLLIAGCTKPPNYPDEPVIEFMSTNISTINQSATVDTLAITFSYTDGDGDLGDSTKNIILTDTRPTIVPRTVEFSLPFIPEQGAGNGISGEITVKEVGKFCCLNIPVPCQLFPESYDTLSYMIKILDREGNESNIVETGPIVIICD